MRRNEMSIAINEQVVILLEHGVNGEGNTSGLRDVAKAIGISDQTLVNLVQGKAMNPRLHTLRALCRHYGISLDYFAAESESDCRHYLNTRRLKNASLLVFEIEEAATRLSPRGQRNVLTMMDWMEMGTRAET